MRITLVLPFVALTGGVRVALAHANGLQALGHQATVVYPHLSPYMTLESRPEPWKDRTWREIRYWVRRLTGRNEVEWYPLRTPLLRLSCLSEDQIPDADIIMAVDWMTAEAIANYSQNKGIKFWLIQHYEVWNSPWERVDKTWQQPLRLVTVSSWLADFAWRRFGRQVDGVVVPGVDFSLFYPVSVCTEARRRQRIGMLYHTLEWKGTADGIRAFEIAREQYPDLQLVMFGRMKPQQALPSGTEFHYRLKQNQLRMVYSSCGTWLVPSWAEGCHLPPMEAMACRCAVVSTDIGGVADYIVPGHTALVSSPQDPVALATNLLSVVSDDALRTRLSDAGYAQIQQLTWERSSRQLEQIFQRALAVRH